MRDLIEPADVARRARRATRSSSSTSIPIWTSNDGPWVFAYARTGGRPLGSRDQVAVVVNAGGQRFPEYWIDWPWGETDRIREHAAPPASDRPQFPSNTHRAALSLAPLQVRAFAT